MVMLNRSQSSKGGSLFPGLETTPDELEFALAMYAFQKKHRRRYPAWSEVLYVLRGLGYSKGTPPDEPPARIPQPYGSEAPARNIFAEIEPCS